MLMKVLHRKSLMRFFLLIVLTLVLCTVFITDNSLSRGVITSKIFWFAFIMCIISFTIPFCFRRNPKIFITDLLFFLFAVYLCISCLFLNSYPSMKLWLTLLMIPLYVAIRNVTSNIKLRRWLLDVILVVVLIETLWGLLQLYGFAHSNHNLYKITGTLFNPGPFSGFVAVAIPLALSYSLDKTLLRIERWLGICTLFFTFLVLPATMSRAAWIAAFFGCIYVLWKWIRLSRINFKDYFQKVHLLDSVFRFFERCISSVVIRIMLALFSSFLAVVFLYGIYLIKKDSAKGRSIIWSSSMIAVKERPLLGHGFGSFTAVYGDTQAEYFLANKRSENLMMLADSPDYAFNEYVQIAVELGLVGLVIFLSLTGFLFFYPCSSFFNAPRSALIVFLFFSTFSYPFSVLPLSIIFVFLVALLAPSSKNVSFILPVWIRIAGVVVCWGITAFCAHQILPKRSAFQEWQSLQENRNEYSNNEDIHKYRALYQSLRHEKHFLFEYGLCLSKTGQYSESNIIYEEYLNYGSDPMVYNCMGNNFKEMGEFDKAENMYIHALKIVPNRHYPLYLLMKLYKDNGQAQKAKDIAISLFRKPVKVSSTAIREMREEARKIIIASEE